MRAPLLVVLLLSLLALSTCTHEIVHRKVMVAPPSAQMCYYLSYSTICVASPSDCLDLVNTEYTLAVRVYVSDSSSLLMFLCIFELSFVDISALAIAFHWDISFYFTPPTLSISLTHDE